MKRKVILPTKSIFLFIAPSLSLLFCLLFFLILGSHFFLQPGIAVKVPTSPFFLVVQENPYVISITGAPSPQIYFESQPIKLESLREKLKNIKGTKNLIIKADDLAPYQLVINVIAIGEEEGFSTVLATSPTTR